MTTPNSNNLYTLGTGTASNKTFIEVFLPKDPSGSDTNYQVQQRWWNTDTNTEWVLVGFTPANGVVSANWQQVVAGSSNLEDLIPDTGTSPVTPSAEAISISGGVIAAGTTPVITNGTNEHTLTVQVQTSQAVADADATKIGLSNFNSADFTVDSTGFVSAIGGGFTRTVTVDAHTSPGTDPVVPTAGGTIIVTGGQVAAGTTANAIQTDSLAANTYTIQVQRSQAVASSTVGDNGVSHFNSTDFTVDANGFVTTAGGAFARKVEVDAATGPGTNPVLPNASGVITVTGGQVAAGTTANVIQTDSLAANTWTVQVQRSRTAASSTVGDNGVCHFDQTAFAVDANGFVSLAGGDQAITSVGVQAGTNPVLPTTGGLVTIDGAVVAAGTTPIQSNGTGANTLAIQVQTSQAIAAADATKIGLSNFNSADFTVDSTGFVSASGGGYVRSIEVDDHTSPGTEPVDPSSLGVITVTGGQVAASAIGANVIETNSLAANAYTIQIQQSGSAASEDTTKNGVCHFDSADFTVTDGFVTLIGGSGLSLGAFGSTPNTDGLSLTTGVLNMQPADGTNPGGVSTTTQTMAGAKTFSTSVTTPIANITGSGSGTITIQGQAAAGTYNFNLPTTAGTSGYYLVSGGGVGAPMTWAASDASVAITQQVITTTGTYTPTAGTTYCVVECLGGGGAGGGAPATTSGQVSTGSGGGAGAYSKAAFLISDVTGATVTIGAAGVPVSGTTGGDGGDTSFGAFLTAPGGSGGIAQSPTGTANGSAGGAGGVAGTSSGTRGAAVLSSGSSGVSSWSIFSPEISSGGQGANSLYGQGGIASVVQQVGGDASGFGAGGGGSENASSQSDQSAGTGAPGVVIITEYA